jgi:hypothetical protein
MATVATIPQGFIDRAANSVRSLSTDSVCSLPRLQPNSGLPELGHY